MVNKQIAQSGSKPQEQKQTHPDDSVWPITSSVGRLFTAARPHKHFTGSGCGLMERNKKMYF